MPLEKIRIVLADDNPDFIYILDEYLSNIQDFSVIGTANNGIDALKLIKESKPDVVILDIVMPQLDGIGVIQRINELRFDIKPQIIVLSAIGQDKTVQLALSLGADYFIVKPFNMEDLVLRIKQLQALRSDNKRLGVRNFGPLTENGNTDEKRIMGILDEIGVPVNLSGYKYLIQAIKMVLNDLTAINSIHKTIYTNIAEKYNTTPARVERSIRNAIEITWYKGNLIHINSIFSYENSDHTRPTNSEFIIKVLDQLKRQ